MIASELTLNNWQSIAIIASVAGSAILFVGRLLGKRLDHLDDCTDELKTKIGHEARQVEHKLGQAAERTRLEMQAQTHGIREELLTHTAAELQENIRYRNEVRGVLNDHDQKLGAVSQEVAWIAGRMGREPHHPPIPG